MDPQDDMQAKLDMLRALAARGDVQAARSLRVYEMVKLAEGPEDGAQAAVILLGALLDTDPGQLGASLLTLSVADLERLAKVAIIAASVKTGVPPSRLLDLLADFAPDADDMLASYADARATLDADDAGAGDGPDLIGADEAAALDALYLLDYDETAGDDA